MAKLTNIEHLKAAAEKSKTYTSGLVAELAETVAEAVAEADEVKADKPVSVALTITTADWYASGIKDYPYAWDFTVGGLTENDIVTVAVTPKSQTIATECGLCAANTSSENTLTLYAVSVPTSAITAEYYVTAGNGN
ncbi:MAG: hypothetical protein LIO59_00290 [Oscillospiraceae bacterium]|nr:hypothetical protein [Oscillospiraceae bacterium]